MEGYKSIGEGVILALIWESHYVGASPNRAFGPKGLAMTAQLPSHVGSHDPSMVKEDPQDPLAS